MYRWLVPLLSVALLLGCGGGTAGEPGEPIYSPEDGIFFNGIYVDNMRDYSIFLRFFPDGSVIRVQAVGTPRTVAKYMTHGYRELSKGTYAIDGNSLTIETRGRAGDHDIEGTIYNDRFDCEVYDYATEEWSEERTFRYKELDDLPEY
jgi:hypothetical protein